MWNPEDDESVKLNLIDNDECDHPENNEYIIVPTAPPPEPAESLVLPESRCPVCLDSIQVDDDVKTTSCNHIFHRRCVDQWLSNHNTCPECRMELFDVSELPVPPGRDPEGYLCVCRQTYCCYSPLAMRRCSYIMYFILAIWMVWLIFGSFTNYTGARDTYFILSIIVEGILLALDIILFIMLRFNIQFNNWRFIRVQPFVLPI